MNELLPIIRRVRRPLSVPESLHDLPPMPPVMPVVETPVVTPVKESQPKKSGDEDTDN
jgi:hypothetical protein